jgi:hypothetical protein
MRQGRRSSEGCANVGGDTGAPVDHNNDHVTLEFSVYPHRNQPMRLALTLAMTACLLPAGGRIGAQTFEPRSTPGAGQKLLEKFAGDWSVTKTFYPRAGAPVRATGRCRQTMIHEGRFLQSEFVFEQDGKKTTGLGTIGFEPESGKFTSFWTDSRQTRMSVRRSQEPFDGKQIVLYSRSLDPDRPERTRSKTVSLLEDDGRKLVHRQFALESNGRERLMMELIMTKDKMAEQSH